MCGGSDGPRSRDVLLIRQVHCHAMQRSRGLEWLATRGLKVHPPIVLIYESNGLVGSVGFDQTTTRFRGGDPSPAGRRPHEWWGWQALILRTLTPKASALTELGDIPTVSSRPLKEAGGRGFEPLRFRSTA